MTRIPADERRAQLVDAAIRVMVRDGVGRATTRAVVAEADMPLGVFHYCFRSKQELLRAVIETILARVLTPALAVVQRPGDARPTLRDPLPATLRASVQVYWDHVIANPGEHQLTYELTQYALRRPGLADVARRQYDGYLAANAQFLQAVADAADIEWVTPVDVLAAHLVSVLDGLTLQWLVNRDGAVAERVLDALAEYVARQAASVASSRGAVGTL